MAILVVALGICISAHAAAPDSSQSEGSRIDRKAAVDRFSAQPDFFDVKLSPGGTRVATVARLSGNVTTLIVWDVESEQARPVFRLGVPLQVRVREYGWINEDNLVAWVVARDPNAGASVFGNSSGGSGSSDSQQLSELFEGNQVVPGTYTYVAHIDVANRKVTPRQYLDPPTETTLVRAPMSDGKSVLLSECFGRFLTEARELEFSSDSSVSYSSSSDSSSSDSSTSESSSFSAQGAITASSTSESEVTGTLQTSPITDRCVLKQWAPDGIASKVARVMYGNRVAYLANYKADHVLSQGRKRNGDVFKGSWSSGQKQWDEEILSDGQSLYRQDESAEVDDPEFWEEVYELMPVAGEPAGRVVMTSASQSPVAIQVTRPGRRLIIMDEEVTDLAHKILGAFPSQIVDLLSVSESKDTVLFSVSDRIDPGGYYLWRRGAGEAVPLFPRYKKLPAQFVGTNLEVGWTSEDNFVGVTRPATGTKRTGIVVMPALVSDEAAFAAFSEFDMEVQWLVANGLTVVQVPVGAPGSLPREERGEAWRRSLGIRMQTVMDRARRDFTAVEDSTMCLYGRGLAGYAALAANAYGSGIACVVAINAALEPDMMLTPYKRVHSLGGDAYLGHSYESMASWEATFGDDLESAAPGNWRFIDYSRALLAYQMYDPDVRPLASQTNATRSAIRKAHGDSELYEARTYTGNIDYWNSRLFLTVAEFLAPTKKRKSKDPGGTVTIYEVGPDESLPPNEEED